MSFVIGTRCYGYVDHLPGVGCVATQFFHVNYLPLFPLKSFLILAGRDDEGVELPMSGKSVLAGYLRGWGTGVAAVAGAVGWFGLGQEGTGMNLIGFAAGAVAVGLVLVAALVWGKLWLVGQAGFHLGSAAGATAVMFTPKGLPGWVLGIIAVANAGLLVVALTRLMDNAGWGRAVKLVEQLGHDRPTAEEIVDELTAARRRTADDA